ncbi:hypothetical protein MRS44_014445 [Fusarium solani]|uniref:uncharacterized protein n=1 Tax=Fusarium solani TaxID=169388 RepID=UPI0032C46CDB|nr:hypothetical protein MRS44_014445 [Fusarium solani]
MTSHDHRFPRLDLPMPCLRCLRHEIRQANRAIARAEAAPTKGTGLQLPTALPITWPSIECDWTDICRCQCDLCYAENNICSRAGPGMIIGDKQDMIATICYIFDILSFQHPSSSAVIEEGDGFAHLFYRATRAVVVKALAKLGAAFDVMVTRHEGEHKLLGSHRPEIMRPRERDVGFLDWNTAVQDFRGAVTRAMEDAHMAQGAIDLVVSKLPI